MPRLHSCRLLGTALLVAPAGRAGAQTDSYNTDSGRPLFVEDATPVERYAIELQLAPVRLEHAGRRLASFTVEPEIAYGTFPAPHVHDGGKVPSRDSARTP